MLPRLVDCAEGHGKEKVTCARKGCAFCGKSAVGIAQVRDLGLGVLQIFRFLF